MKQNLLLLPEKFRFLLFLCCLLAATGHAQLQINAITPSVSTCPNNGSITVSATTSNPPLVYSIISGPVLQPVQTSNVFSSLPPGSYTVQVADGAGAIQTQSTTITGNYLTLDFTPVKESPYCNGGIDGSLTGNIVPGTGLAPFTWELIAPSAVTAPSQSSNVFEDLPAGSYTMRVTDACNNFRTLAVTIPPPGTSLAFYGGLTAEKVGCDSMLVRYRMIVNPNAPRPPFTFGYRTSNGTFNPSSGTVIDSSLMHTTGYVDVEQLIPGLTYGDYIRATVTDTCGNQAISAVLYTYPFYFYPQYGFNQCGSAATAFFENPPNPYSGYHTFLMHPVTYSMTNVSTGIVEASGTAPNTSIAGIGVSTPLTPGSTYHLVLTDGCGDVFEHDYTIPSQAPPQITGATKIYEACIDSVVGTYRITVSGLGANPRLILLSGPSSLGSTKPEFSYSGTYSYPDTVPGNSAGIFFMSNLGPGTYTYKVIDACGHELTSAFTITPQQVTSLSRSVTYKRGCPGQNKIYFSLIAGGTVTIRDITSNTVIEEREFDNYGGYPTHNDSVLNVPSGIYEVIFQFEHNNSQEMNTPHIPCWTITDTIEIGPYEFPDVFTSNSILCNNDVYIELIPDSTKGIPPFQYEIFSGPATFPLQGSNVFQVNQPGIYNVRIHDACGNASAKQVTVEAIAFAPPESTSDCNNTHIVFSSSIYDSYHWTAPDGTTFIADSLMLDPVTPSDTGIYEIDKIININGCIDTLHTTYHVTMPNFLMQTVAFCPGTTVTIGSSEYDTPGIYYDTLQTTGGCDSVIVTSLVLHAVASDTAIVTICSGDSYQIGSNSYFAAGFYRDSTQNSAGCYDYAVTDLRISGGSFAFSATICAGDSIFAGNSYYHTTGTHTAEIVTASGCDSIITLNLTVIPAVVNTINQTICEGETFSYDGNAYTQSGTYTHVFPTAGCDSTIILNLTVLPLKHSEITQEICAGEQYILNGQAYNQPGVYSQVFPTAGCDSIVTLTLTVHSRPSIDITSDFYEVSPGDSVHLGINTTNQPLSYSWTGEAAFSDPSVRDPWAVITDSCWISVTVTDTNGCTATDHIDIGAKITSTLYVPNSFTPNNGDGVNDIFHVAYTNIAQFNIMIFDRWGEIIFESNDIDFGWDGTYKGRIVQDGIYVYRISAIGMDYHYYELTGHVTVIK